MHPTPRRGFNVLNALLFEENTESPQVATVKAPGRDPLLIERRDDLLLHRVFYKTRIQRKIYEDVFLELETEMFLSRIMLQKIIQQKGDNALQIKKKYAGMERSNIRRELQRQWPWVLWD